MYAFIGMWFTEVQEIFNISENEILKKNFIVLFLLIFKKVLHKLGP